MKKIVVIILYLLNVSLIYTQNTSRFPIHPAGVWKMQYSGLYEEIYEYYIEGDTLINSQSYYKVYKSGVTYYDTPFYYERIYVGALRDYDNKFFYVKKDEPTEVQLFDFNLEPGDTIESLIGNGKIINFIDTLPDGRKRMEQRGICVVSCPVIQIIEGIGHAGGIMKDPPDSHVGFAGHNLLCYFENEELVYHNNFGFTDARCEQNTLIQSDCNINREI